MGAPARRRHTPRRSMHPAEAAASATKGTSWRRRSRRRGGCFCSAVARVQRANVPRHDRVGRARLREDETRVVPVGAFSRHARASPTLVITHLHPRTAEGSRVRGEDTDVLAVGPMLVDTTSPSPRWGKASRMVRATRCASAAFLCTTGAACLCGEQIFFLFFWGGRGGAL